MNDAGKVQPLDLVLRQVQLARNGDGKPSDVLLMPGGIGVAHLRRVGERGDRGFQARHPALIRGVALGRHAQRPDAKGCVVRKLLQQCQRIVIERVRFSGGDGQHREYARGILQRQYRDGCDASALCPRCPRRQAVASADILNDLGFAAADRAAMRTVAGRVINRPRDAHPFGRWRDAGPRGGGDRFGRIALHDPDPGDQVAAILDNRTTHLGLQFTLVRGPDDGMVDAAQGAQRAVDPQ